MWVPLAPAHADVRLKLCSRQVHGHLMRGGSLIAAPLLQLHLGWLSPSPVSSQAWRHEEGGSCACLLPVLPCFHAHPRWCACPLDVDFP